MYWVSQPIPHPCPCFSAHNPLLWFPANYIWHHTEGEKRTNFSLSGNLPMWQFTVFLFWKFYDPNHLWQLLYRLKYYIEEWIKPITQTNYSTNKTRNKGLFHEAWKTLGKSTKNNSTGAGDVAQAITTLVEGLGSFLTSHGAADISL